MLLLVLLSIQSNHCMLLQTLCRERCFQKVSKCQRHCSAVVSIVPRREIPTCHDQSSFLCLHMADLWCATRVYSGLISVFSVHYTAANGHWKIWHRLPAVCRWHWLYDSFQPDQLAATMTVQHLQNCCCEISDWLSSNKPKSMMERLRPLFLNQRHSSQ